MKGLRQAAAEDPQRFRVRAAVQQGEASGDKLQGGVDLADTDRQAVVNAVDRGGKIIPLRL